MREFFFLLAGGYGKRTEPLSFFKPKPAFPLDGTPLIRIMLMQLAGIGLTEGFVNLHHLPEVLRHIIDALPGLKVTYLYEEVLSGSRILNNAVTSMAAEDLVVVMNGDIFLELPYEEMRAKLLNENADGVLLVRPYPAAGTYRGLKIDADCFVRRTEAGDLMYTGVALFTRKVLAAIEEINFFDTLESHSFNIKVLPYTGIWLDIGDIPSYREANFRYRSYCLHNTGKHDKEDENQGNSVSVGVSISADSRVTGSIIWENTRIKNQCFLRNCIVTNDLCLNGVTRENEIITKQNE